MEQLKELGVGAEVVSAAMPVGKSDVQGLMSGVADYSWGKLHNKILPGAICENFTSFGGMMTEGSAQTPLSELLRYGAAGSSGTVIEPYAMEDKFPSPFMQVHYARGCTLAESYYQSVFAPGQLLIVGDPLCRPWANIPKLQFVGPKPGSTVSGSVVLKPDAKLPRPGKIERFELFVDGRRMSWTPAGGSLTWDSTADGDGYHELRVVAIEEGPIETQGRAILPLVANNKKRTALFSTSPAKTVRWDEPLKVTAKLPGVSDVIVMHNMRTVGKIAGDQGEVEINPRLLGTGPVTLYAAGLLPGGGSVNRFNATPVRLTVEPPKPLPPLKDPPKNLVRGLLLKLPNKKVVPIQDTHDPVWLTLAGLQSFEPYVVQGYFDVAKEDLYQFQLWHYGELKLTVDGTVLYNEPKGNNTEKFLPVALAAGTHRLTVSGKAADDLTLRILFGGPGTHSLNGTTFRHAR